MATTPNELYAECLARPGDWAWQSWHEGDAVRQSDDRPTRAHNLDVDGPQPRPFVVNPSAKPCQVCGSDFYWQDTAGALWCVQCADPPSLAMVQAVWQVVVRGGERGAIDATYPCLDIWQEVKNSGRAKNS